MFFAIIFEHHDHDAAPEGETKKIRENDEKQNIEDKEFIKEVY